MPSDPLADGSPHMSVENGEDSDWTRTTISASESQLEELKSYAAESDEYTSLSHFLRAVGMREVRGEDPADVPEINVPESLDEDVDQLSQEVEAVKSELSQIRDLVETVEVRSRKPSEEIEELQNILFDELPGEDATEIAENAIEAGVTVSGRFSDEYRYLDERPTPGWPEDLKEAVDAERKVDVVEALERMADSMGVVDKTEIDNETWYFSRV